MFPSIFESKKWMYRFKEVIKVSISHLVIVALFFENLERGNINLYFGCFFAYVIVFTMIFWMIMLLTGRIWKDYFWENSPGFSDESASDLN